MRELLVLVCAVFFSCTAGLPVSSDCPKGWATKFNSCYKLVVGNDKTSSEAKSYCASLAPGAHLVDINTYTEFKYLISKVKKFTEKHGYQFINQELWWTSGTLNSAGEWYWNNEGAQDEPFEQWGLWYPGEPNNSEGNEDRMDLMLNNGDWGLNDDKGSMALRFICELSLDYEGSADEEACPSDWQETSQSCYKFIVGNDRTPDAAASYCQALDPLSHLVSINNREEFDYLTEAIPEAIKEAGDYPNYRELWWTSGEKNEDGEWYWHNHRPMDPSGCSSTVLGKEYRGTVAETTGGKTCQRWDSQYPHEHSRWSYFDEDASEHQNYCRNPDNEPLGPWCYTTDPNVRWEYCDVPKCPTDAPLSWSLWYPGEPNNDGGEEDHINLLLLYGDWGFNDIDDTNRLRFICEIDKD